jgi:predicted PurR-regulated permease PerM
MKQQWDPAFRYILLAVLIIVAGLALWYVRESFQPLITAALAAYFLSPMVNFISARLRIRRKVAANVVYFSVLVIMIALPFTILPSQLDEIQGIFTDLNESLDGLQALPWLQEPHQLGGIRFYLGGLIPAIRSNLSGAFVPAPEDALHIIEITSRNFLWFLVILVTTYFLMTDWDRLRSWAIKLAPPNDQSDLHRLYREIRAIWMGYLGGQIRLIAILAVIYAIAWSAIGLPGAILIGALAGLLNLIPEVGPAGAAVLATIVALIEGSTYLPLSNAWFALLTLGLYLVLNNIKTIWLQPRILGHSVLLHEGVVFVAIVTAIILQGVLGVLVVVPLLATLGVAGRYLRRRLLGLTPFEEESHASAQPATTGAAQTSTRETTQ